MNNIENKVVEMKFDNSQFEAAVAKTMDTLDKFKQKLNFDGAGKGLDKLGKASNNYQYTLNDIGQSVDQLNSKFSAMGNIGRRVLENLTDSAYKFVSKGIGGMISGVTAGGLSRAMNLEQAKFQLQGIFKDANEVKRVIYDDILPELQGTPYSLDQAAVVMGQLAASGKTTSFQIQRATRGIAGLAAMTNHSFADVGRIFTKVAGNGVIMAQELNQLSGYGINAASDLSNFFKMAEKDASLLTPAVVEDLNNIKEAFGEFNEANIREAASKRMISYGSMAAAMDVLYGEHAKKSTTMYTGALEDLKAALARIGAEPAAVGLEFLRDAFNALVPAVDAVNAVLKPFTSATKDVMEINGEAAFGGAFAGSLSKKVQDLGHSFQSMFVTLDKDNNILRFTKDNIKELQVEMRHIPEWVEYLNSGVSEGDAIMNPRMWKILNSSTKSFVNILTAAGKVLKAIGAGIAAAFPKVTLKTFSDIAGSIETFTSHLILSEESLERLKWITQGVFTPIGLLFSALISLAKGAIKAFSSLYEVLKPVIQAIFSFSTAVGKAVVGIGQFIKDVVTEAGGIASIFGGIILKVAEFLKLDRALEIFKNIFVALAGTFDSIGDKANSAFSSIVPKLKDFASSIAEFLHIKEVAAAFQSFFTTIKNGIAKVLHLDQIKNSIKGLSDAFKEFFDKNKFFAGILEDIKTFVEWIQKMIPLETILGKVGDAFTYVTDKAAGLTKGPATFIGKMFSTMATNVKEFFTSTKQAGFFQQFLRDVIHPYDTFLSLQQKFNKAIVPTIQLMGQLIPLAAGFDTWGDMVAATGAKLGGVVKSFLSFLGVITSIGTDNVSKSAAEFKKNISLIFGSLKTKAVSDASSAAEKFKSFSEKLSSVFKFIGDVIGKFVSEHSNAEIKKLIATLILFLMAFSYLRTMRSMFHLIKDATIGFTAFKGLGMALRGAIKSISGISTAFKEFARFTGLAILLVAFAGSIYIISQIDTDKLKVAAVTMLLAAGILAALMVALSHITATTLKTGPKALLGLYKLSMALAGLGIAMLGIAGAIKILSGVWKDAGNASDFWMPIIGIIAVLAGFGVITGVIARFPAAAVAMSKIGLAFIGLSTAIKLLSETVAELSKLSNEGVDLQKGVTVLLEIMLAISGLTAVLSILTNAKALLAFAVNIVVVTTVIYALIPALWLLSKVNMSKGLIQLGILMGVLSLFAILSGVASRLGGLAALATASALLVLGTIAIVEMARSLAMLADIPVESLNRALISLSIVMLLLGALSAVSAATGQVGAMGMAGIAAVAIGLSMLADSIARLGELSLWELAKGIGGLGVAIIALGAALVIFSALSKFILTPVQAASIMLLGAGVYFLANALSVLAGMPLDALALSIFGIVGAMLAAGVVMAAFSLLGPGLILVAGAFALVGVAAVLVGGGIYIATLALATLIPLIQVLGNINVTPGLEVLKEVAKGVGDAFLLAAAGVGELAFALLGLGVSVIVVAVGIALIGVACLVTSLGVLSLAGAFSVLFTVLNAQFPALLGMITNGLSVIGQGIGKFFDGILDKIRNHYQQERDIAVNGIEGVDQATQEAYQNQQDHINQKLQIGGKKHKETVEQNKQELTSAYQNGGDPFTETTASWMTETEAVLDENGNVVGDKSEYLKTIMASKFGEGGNPFADGTQMDINQMQAILDSGGDSSSDKASLINSMMASGFDANGNPLDPTSFVDSFNTKMDSAANDGYDSGSKISFKTAQGILDGKPAVTTNTTGLTNSVKTTLGAVDTKPEGKKVATGYAAGERSGVGEVSSAASSITSAGTPPSGYGSAYSLGQYAAQGYYDGMRSMINTIAAGAAAVVSAAKQAAQNAQNSNSPSKDFMKYGQYADQGYILGLKSLAGKVASTAGDVIHGGLDAAAEAMSNIASVFDSDMDFTPTITPVVDLTNVRQGVDGINTMFGDSFGLSTPYSNFLAAQKAAMSLRDTSDEFDAITKLAKEIGVMTDTMNSRQMINNIQIEGSEDPNAFADALTRRFKLNARTM